MPVLKPDQFPFRTELAVRDYECDMEGIVNNAVYQNYLEHARHLYLRSRGVDFASLIREGVHLVVVRAELDYLSPLRSGDGFLVGVRVERLTKLRGVFHQAVFRKPEFVPVLRSQIVGASLNAEGRPAPCSALDEIFPDSQFGHGV